MDEHYIVMPALFRMTWTGAMLKPKYKCSLKIRLSGQDGIKKR